MKPLIFSLAAMIILMSSAKVWSQISTIDQGLKNKLQLYWGYHLTKSHDLIFSPMIYSGNTAVALSLEYERGTPHGLHQIRLAYDKTNVSGTPLISWEAFEGTRMRQPGEALQLNISYAYLHQFFSSEDFQFYLGGLLEARIHHTSYYLGISEEEGYVLSNSLNTSLQVDYRLNEKNTVRASFYIPVLSWISRPEYAIVDNEEIQHEGSDLAFVYQQGKLASWGTYRALNCALAFTHSVSSAVNLSFRYQLDYFRYTEPLKASVLRNYWDVGVGFNF